MSQPVTNLLINGLNPVSVGGTGTAIKYFPIVPGASIGVASTKNGYLYVSGNGSANGQQLSVRASGNLNVGAGAVSSPLVTVGLYPVTFVGTVGTIVSTAIISQQSTTAMEPTQAAIPWALNVNLIGDTLSGLVQAIGGAIAIDGTAGTFSTGLVTGLTAINFSNPIPYGVVVGVTFSQSESGNNANMYQFEIQS